MVVSVGDGLQIPGDRGGVGPGGGIESEHPGDHVIERPRHLRTLAQGGGWTGAPVGIFPIILTV